MKNKSHYNIQILYDVLEKKDKDKKLGGSMAGDIKLGGTMTGDIR